MLFLYYERDMKLMGVVFKEMCLGVMFMRSGLVMVSFDCQLD
jgi:hypothetical protein